MTTSVSKLIKSFKSGVPPYKPVNSLDLGEIITAKVEKTEHKRKKPNIYDGTLRKCIRLLKDGANPNGLWLTKDLQTFVNLFFQH